MSMLKALFKCSESVFLLGLVAMYMYIYTIYNNDQVQAIKPIMNIAQYKFGRRN